jgi:ABC-type nitrate/sulfonate/bicarbonate transport system substrate-binding protein
MEGDEDIVASEEAEDDAEAMVEEYDMLKETGELDLPEDEEEVDESESEDEVSDEDGHLADYYRELGISKDMKRAKASTDEPVYKTTSKKQIAAEKAEATQDEVEKKKGDVIDALIQKTRDDPCFK